MVAKDNLAFTNAIQVVLDAGSWAVVNNWWATDHTIEHQVGFVPSYTTWQLITIVVELTNSRLDFAVEYIIKVVD